MKYEEECNRLHSKLISKEKELEIAKDTIKQLQEQADGNKAKNEEFIHEFEGLVECLKKLKEKENAAKIYAMISKEKELEIAKDTIQKLTAKNKELKGKVKDLRDEIKEWQKNKEKVAKKYNNMVLNETYDIDYHSDCCYAKDAEIEKLRKYANKLHKDLMNLQEDSKKILDSIGRFK